MPTPLQTAQKLLASNEPHEALVIVNQLISKNPKNWSAHMRRGKIFEWLGRFEEAREEFARAGELGAEPAAVKNAVERVDALDELIEEAKEALNSGDNNQAVILLEKAKRKIAIGIIDLHLARAKLGQGEVSEAEELIDAFLDARPNHDLGIRIKEDIKAHLDGKAETAPKRFGPKSGKDDKEQHEFEKRLKAKVESIDGTLATDREQALKDIRWIRANERKIATANWANDVHYAKAAHFAFAKGPAAAIENYDPYLLEKSVEFGYLTWPRRIQEQIRHRKVLDIGCGFGAYGNGFLAAGASEYTGIDPQMPLDSPKVKNKRKRKRADLGMTPREIMERCPNIRLINGVFEDLATDDKFGAVTLHNVTEHLHNIRSIIPDMKMLFEEDGYLIYHHHNFYCWNGHHKAPVRPEAYTPGDEEQDKVADWNHILIAPDVPDDHYFNTNLNQIRLDEIKAITYEHYDVEVWKEIESPQSVRDRLTDRVMQRLQQFDDTLSERDLMVNAVLCIAQPKR